MLQHSVRDMAQDERNAANTLAQHVARKRMIEQEQRQYEQMIQRTQECIALEVRSGRDDRARDAIAQLLAYEQRRDALSALHSDYEQMIERWTRHLQDVRQKLCEAVQKRDMLIHRAQMAWMQKKFAQQCAIVSDMSAHGVFRRMEQKVIALEAEAEIMHNGTYRAVAHERIEEKLSQYKQQA
jgi:phage shock protein A